MGFIKKFLLITLLLAVLIAGLIASAPLTIPTLATPFLKQQGITVNSIQLRIPSTSAWIVKTLQVQTAQGVQIDVDTMILRFSFAELFKGKLQAIDIESLTVSRSGKVEPTTEDAETDTLSSWSPQQWLADFPIGRIYIRQGLIDERISINGFDLQINSEGLALNGLLNIENQDIVVKGQIGNDDQFSLLINAGDSQFQSQGQISDNTIKGQGSTQATLLLAKPWLPEELQGLDGTLESTIDFGFIFQNNNIESDIKFAVEGDFSLPEYFESLKLKQALTLSGSLLSPNLLISPGDSLTIRKLHQPFEYDQVVIALTSALELKQLNKGLNVKQSAALQFRSDKDEVDVVFTGSRIAINGQVASIRPDFYVSSDLEVLSFSPLSLKILKGGQLSLGRVGDLGKVTAILNDDSQLSENQKVIQFDNKLSLGLHSDSLALTVTAEGELAPLDLRLITSTKNLKIDSYDFGSAVVNLLVKQIGEQIEATLESEIAGVEVVGSGQFGLETKLGNIQLQAPNLRQLTGYLSAQCIEVKTGSALISGNIDMRSSLKMAGNFGLDSIGLIFQDSPYNNIKVDGTWRYSEVAKNFDVDANLSVPEFNIGVLVQDLNAQLRYSGEVIMIDKVQGQVLGGRLYGINLRWRPQQERNDLQLYLEEIDLRQLVALEDYQGLEVSGKINASLPLVVDSAGVQVIGGTIEAVKPGGEIHLPVDATGRKGAQKEAFEALQNFHFETLSGGISGPLALDPNGVLVSNLTLRGTNPDMGRPVSLNLSIEQNTYPIFQTLELFDKINRIGQCSR